MARPRQYATIADRQKAYRERYRQRIAAAGSPPPRQSAPIVVPKAIRKQSRPARLAQVLKDLQALLVEYEDWLNALPESLQESSVADKLSETVEQLQAAIDLLIDLEPPKGFGRD